MRTGRRFEEARITNPRQRFLCRQSEARIANPRQRFLIVSAIVACAGCQRNGLQIRASFFESASI